MAKYTVQMTFLAPAQAARVKDTKGIPGIGMSLRIIGGDGHLAVSASGVARESAAEAALAVQAMVNRSEGIFQGPITMVSWVARRDRVLAGFGRRPGREGVTSWPPRSSGGRGGDGDEGDTGGSAGVREPRRPLPGPGSLQAALDLPGSEITG